MGIRNFERIPVFISVTIQGFSDMCVGTMTNLSESGMFIRTNKMLSPSDTDVEVMIPLDEGKLQVPARIIRTENIRDYCHGIGVLILNPPKKYLDFLDHLITVL
jgi:Tfp pilus assembly protein PilZ